MTTTPTLYACTRHPTVRAELHVRGTVSCTLCGRPLRQVEAVAEETPPKEKTDGL